MTQKRYLDLQSCSGAFIAVFDLFHVLIAIIF